MINEGAKKVFHLLHEQQALSDCSQYRKHSNAKRSTAVSSSELFPGGYAGVWLSYVAVFQQISDRFNEKCVCVCVGGGGKVQDTQKEQIQIATYPTLKYSWHWHGIIDLC